MNIYAIYDSKIESYGTPVFIPNDRVAQRSVEDLVREGTHDAVKYPEDFSLFRLGRYCDQSGTIEPLDSPVLVAKMHEVVAHIHNDDFNRTNHVKEEEI